ncbi:protein IQ-DOMAIN 14 [Senna tora]|uniref:Protein IQ-DOMAIN 14 n=1 Tax=Senna tora TaxID=362788 RepID=A0A834SZV1_9FABA|nr:protein IQ-DOMAIN 14 [Senna tora]
MQEHEVVKEATKRACRAILDAKEAQLKAKLENIRLEKLQLQFAAIKIQTFIRGTLARKAFRALRSLVKFQAIVRGVIARKATRKLGNRVQFLLSHQDRAPKRRIKGKIKTLETRGDNYHSF